MTDLTALRRVAALDVKTKADIKAIRANTPYFGSQVSTGVKAWFLFNEKSGNTYEEISGNAGTVTGAVWGQDEDGIYLWFDGANDEVDFGTDTSYHAGVLTLATWDIVIKPENRWNGKPVYGERGRHKG